MKKTFLLAGLILSWISPAAAQMPPPPAMPPRADPAFLRLRDELAALRQEAIALQASDGGTLTTEHRDSIQTRLDAAHLRYHNLRRRLCHPCA